MAAMMQLGSDEPRRLVHFTPLRYPGGKGKLAAYVKDIIRSNGLQDGDYIEPYAGGAAIGMELLLQEYVWQIRINDISRPVYAFWKSVLDDTDELCRLVKNTRLSVVSWDRQKQIFANPDDHSDTELGFATFFLNRTNRSGILNGGVIGGREQAGPWKIDARYNADELVFRIDSIARMRHRIKLSRRDAISFLRSGLSKWPVKALIYLDPPYYDQGRELYYDYYKPEDHATVAKFVASKMAGRSWIVSYDNVPAIRRLYADYRSIVYNVGYTARDMRTGREVMFFAPKLSIPRLVGPVEQVGRIRQPRSADMVVAKKLGVDEGTIQIMRRMLSTPPKPHDEMKVGRTAAKSGPKPRPANKRKAKAATRD